MKQDCPNCEGTGCDPACEWDVLPGETPCDPPHPCHACQPEAKTG